MKKAILIVSSLLLSVSLAQAKDKDYRVNVKTNDLQVGKSNIEIHIKRKSVSVNNANVKLNIYHPDDSVTIYKAKKSTEKNKYVFKVNTLLKGEYRYLLKFNRMGGVNHYKRGSWEL